MLYNIIFLESSIFFHVSCDYVAVTYVTFFLFNNLLYGVYRQTMVAIL